MIFHIERQIPIKTCADFKCIKKPKNEMKGYNELLYEENPVTYGLAKTSELEHLSKSIYFADFGQDCEKPIVNFLMDLDGTIKKYIKKVKNLH